MSTLANASRVVAGFGLILRGIVLLNDWHGIRRRLAPHKRPRPFNVFSVLALFAGGGAIVTGIVRMLGA